MIKSNPIQFFSKIKSKRSYHSKTESDHYLHFKSGSLSKNQTQPLSFFSKIDPNRSQSFQKLIPTTIVFGKNLIEPWCLKKKTESSRVCVFQYQATISLSKSQI